MSTRVIQVTCNWCYDVAFKQYRIASYVARLLCSCWHLHSEAQVLRIFVTRSDKYSLIVLFCISRNTNLKYQIHCTFLEV